MQTTNNSRKRQNLRQTSCTECRRRKQRCKPHVDGVDGPCWNCTRRFPPVKCVGRSFLPVTTSIIPIRLGGHSTQPSPTASASSASSRHENDDEDGEAENVTGNQVARRLATHQGKIPYRSPYSKDYKSPYGSPDQYESPKHFGDTLSDINTANIIPVNATSRNNELFCYCVKGIYPRLMTLDGEDVPPIFHQKVLPLILQSPLLPKIAILEASGFYAINRGIEVSKNEETIALRSEVLRDIKNMIEGDFEKVWQGVIQSVMHMTMIDYYWGDTESIWKHFGGLKQMIHLRGGISKLHNRLVSELVYILDVTMACRYEQNLFMLKKEEPAAIPVPIEYAENHSTPFYSKGFPFSTIAPRLKVELTPQVADILDDMRFITSQVLEISTTSTGSPRPSDHQDSEAIQIQASQILSKLRTLPAKSIKMPLCPADGIYETVRITALIYTTAISLRIPLSRATTPLLRFQLHERIWAVSTSTWKHIPGIFLWIMLIGLPSSGNDKTGRLLRTNAMHTSTYNGLRNFRFLMACLRGYWGVQRWIAGTEEVEGGDVDGQGQALGIGRGMGMVNEG